MPHGDLWRHADFRKLWAGQTVSLFGSAVTLLALPAVAIYTLGATPAQLGLLSAAGSLPALLFGLVVGAWVDRRRRRPLLVLADLGRGLLLLAIPVAALLGALRMGHLYAVTFLVGTLGLLFDIAAQSLLPALVGRARLVEGNGKLETSRAAAEIAGPNLGGVLVQLATAPLAILADALSFLISGLLVALIRTPEPAPAPHPPGQRLPGEIGEGLRWVVGHPILRPLVGATALLTFANSVIDALFFLYLARDLALPPALFGAALGLGSAGFLLGALAAGRVAARVGIGPTLVGALALVGLGDLVLPLVGGAPLGVGLLLVVAQFLFGLGVVAFRITAVSLRQGLVPDRLLGRVNASASVVVQGLTPLGALLGGLLGERLGLRETLFLAAGGELLAALWLLASPIRRLRGAPAPDERR